MNATVTICHSKTKNLQKLTKSSELIISAVGSPKFLNCDFFNNDQSQIVIDVGISRLPNGQICGDVDFDQVKSMVKAITPVPGGVGPMTILSLARNLLKAAENQIS